MLMNASKIAEDISAAVEFLGGDRGAESSLAGAIKKLSRTNEEARKAASAAESALEQAFAQTEEARLELETALAQNRTELDQLTQKVIAAGLASWSGGENEDRQLIVRGHANLLEDLHALEDLERVRLLFDDLETKRGVIDLLGRAERAEGVRIFIGSENKLFSLSGSSTIIAPYSDGAGHIVGVLGVIGPTRLNYARVIPTVDYAARIVSRMLGG